MLAEVDIRPRNVVVLAPGMIPKTPWGKLRHTRCAWCTDHCAPQRSPVAGVRNLFSEEIFTLEFLMVWFVTDVFWYIHSKNERSKSNGTGNCEMV